MTHNAPPAPWSPAMPNLLPRLRQVMAAVPEGVALLLPPLPPRPRRAARLLLRAQETVLEAASGELLLAGAADLRAVEAGLRALGLPTGHAWRLEEEAAPLLAWAAHAVPAPRPDPSAAEQVTAVVAALPSGTAVVRRHVLALGPGEAPRRLALHHAVSRRLLAEALPPSLAADPDLLEEAATLAEARAAPADGTLPLLLRPGAPAPPGPAIALLPLAAAADPPALAARAAALLDAGWAGVGLDGLDAQGMPLLDPTDLPGEGPVLLRWSPALAGRAARQALRGRLDPGRLVLTGCDGAAALEWGLAAGLHRFAGPVVEAMLA